MIMNMIEKKTWNEFRDIGLLWFINTILHAFGWAIVYDLDNDLAYPAKVKFRGFSGEINDEGYKKIAQYFIKDEENFNEGKFVK